MSKETPSDAVNAFEPCPECFLVVPYLAEHRYIEHGVELDAEHVERLKQRHKEDEERAKRRK